MSFPESTLYTSKHLSFDRADERGIHIKHARLCASQGIEHQEQPNSISHDFQIPEAPHMTLRIVTTLDKKVGKTGYYLPTERAVRERETYYAKLRHAQGVEKERRGQAVATQAKTASSKASQKANQMRRLHNDGRHEGSPNPKCPDCNPN